MSRMDGGTSNNSSHASSEHNLVEDDQQPQRPQRRQRRAAQDNHAPSEVHANNLGTDDEPYWELFKRDKKTFENFLKWLSLNL